MSGKYRMDIRKKFFTRRVVKHWNKFPGVLARVKSLYSSLYGAVVLIFADYGADNTGIF